MCVCVVAQVLSDFKTITLLVAILVYIILNGKGDLTGCGLGGTFPFFLINRSIQYGIFAVSSVYLLLFVVVLYITVWQ